MWTENLPIIMANKRLFHFPSAIYPWCHRQNGKIFIFGKGFFTWKCALIEKRTADLNFFISAALNNYITTSPQKGFTCTCTCTCLLSHSLLVTDKNDTTCLTKERFTLYPKAAPSSCTLLLVPSLIFSSTSIKVGFCFDKASATLSRHPCPRSNPSNFCIAVSASRTVS